MCSKKDESQMTRDDVFRDAFPAVSRAVQTFFDGLPDQFERLGREIAEPGIFGFDAGGACTLHQPDPNQPETNEALAASVRRFTRAAGCLAVAIVAEAKVAQPGNGPVRRAMVVLLETAGGERSFSVWPIGESDDGTQLGQRECHTCTGGFADTFTRLIPAVGDGADRAAVSPRTDASAFDICGARLEQAIATLERAFNASLDRRRAADVMRMFAPSDRFNLLVLRGGPRLPDAAFLRADPSGQVLGVNVGPPNEGGGVSSLSLKRYASVKKFLAKHPSIRQTLSESLQQMTYGAGQMLN